MYLFYLIYLLDFYPAFQLKELKVAYIIITVQAGF